MNAKDIIKNKIENLISSNIVQILKVSSGGLIFNEGDTCESLGYVYKGKINISTLSISSKEEIISTISDGDFFGQFLIFNEENNKYLGDIIANKNSEVVLISKELLYKLFMTDKEFLSAYLSKVSNEAYKIKQQVKLLSHKKNIDRVIYYLKTNNINKEIDIKSITNLSKIVNLPRENVSRIISKLERDGLITKDKNIITLTDKIKKCALNG